jgi:2-phosphoglycerate kinase
MIGGAPRVGKSTLCQQLSAKLGIGWISTDLLMEVLRSKNVSGIKTEWDASPEAITATAEWSFPYIERFIWGVSSMADNYVIEGVDFLPAQVAQLSKQYQIRSIFLGCSKMTLETFDQYPGKSKGYANLPEEFRLQFARDVPRWSKFIRNEAEYLHYPYIDMSTDFPSRLMEAEHMLIDL